MWRKRLDFCRATFGELHRRAFLASSGCLSDNPSWTSCAPQSLVYRSKRYSSISGCASTPLRQLRLGRRWWDAR
jgi:hypothetical protein